MAEGEPVPEDLMEQIRGLRLADFLLSTAVTLASLAFGKLGSGKLGAGELAEARLAIDALAALLPLLEGDAKRDLAQTLANLQLAYAAAATAADQPTS